MEHGEGIAGHLVPGASFTGPSVFGSEEKKSSVHTVLSASEKHLLV